MSAHRFGSEDRPSHSGVGVRVRFPFRYSDGTPAVLEVLRVGIDAEGELVYPSRPEDDDNPYWDCDPDPNILINVVSRRVKQLKRGNRPLVESLEKLSPEDTALREVIEGKISHEFVSA